MHCSPRDCNWFAGARGIAESRNCCSGDRNPWQVEKHKWKKKSTQMLTPEQKPEKKLWSPISKQLTRKAVANSELYRLTSNLQSQAVQSRVQMASKSFELAVCAWLSSILIYFFIPFLFGLLFCGIQKITLPCAHIVVHSGWSEQKNNKNMIFCCLTCSAALNRMRKNGPTPT